MGADLHTPLRRLAHAVGGQQAHPGQRRVAVLPIVVAAEHVGDDEDRRGESVPLQHGDRLPEKVFVAVVEREADEAPRPAAPLRLPQLPHGDAAQPAAREVAHLGSKEAWYMSMGGWRALDRISPRATFMRLTALDALFVVCLIVPRS